MKKELLRFTLYAIMACLTGGTLNLATAVSQPSGGNEAHFCGVVDSQLDKRHSDQFPNRNYARSFASNLNVGEPRTVRLIYFLPKGRTFRTDIVQKMKDEIRNIQTFYAEQMGAHGYGNITFRVETDPQGEPIVHRIDGQGQHPDSDYFNRAESAVLYEIEPVFNLIENIYFIFIDIGEIQRTRGVGCRQGKNGGYAFVTGEFRWHVVAHELGHAFGLRHDFSSDDMYIMSSGPEPSQLSVCHAEFLSVHTYFNPNTPIEAGQPPTIELISPRTYPVGSKGASVRLKVSDSEGLHQVFLHVQTREPHKAAGSLEVKTCRGLGAKKDAVVEFEYDGVIPSDSLTNLSTPIVHPIFVESVDADGNVSRTDFVLFSKTLQPLTKISGDNQTGLPNTPLPSPFVIEVRDLKDGFARSGISITFAVTAGSGTLSTTRTTTDQNGRAESTLTLGPNLGINTVSASAAGIGQTVNFNAVAGNAVDIPDLNLRTVTETTLGKAEGKPIAPAEMVTLTRLEAPEAGISDLTGLEGATNLRGLNLWRNSVSDLLPLVGLTNLTELYLGGNSASDLSPLAGLTNLESLFLDRNGVSDLSALAGLTQLTRLALNNNSVSDLSPLAGLTNLKWMRLASNNISDLSPLVANTGLGSGDTVDVRANSLSYLSIHTHIPTLHNRGVTVEFDNRTHPALLKISGDNQKGASFTPLSQPFVVEAQDAQGAALVGISVTFAVTAGGGTLSTTITRTDENGRAQSTLTLGPNLGPNTVAVSVEGISQTALFRAEATPPLPIPTTLEYVSGNNQSGLTGETLMQPFVVEVYDQYDDPMEGVTVTFVVNIGGGSLSDTSVDSDVNGLARSILTLGNVPVTNIVEVSVEGIAETVTFHAVAELFEFDFALPSGISLIHVPLKVRMVDGVAGTIESVGDLYDTLGGASVVNFLITYDSQAQEWRSFFVSSDKGTPADAALTDDTGIIAGLRSPTSVRLRGDALGTDGNSAITLNQGLNLVGLPLRDPRIARLSDLFALEGIGGNVPVIILTDGGEFKLVGRADDPGDVPVTGEQSFILTAQRAARIDISGGGWYNSSTTTAAPPMVLSGIQVTDTTPVLALRGLIVDEGTGVNKAGLRVRVKNLSTDRAITTVTGDERIGYQLTVVAVETGRAAQIGDILEISAQSPDPFIGVQPLQYIVTAEDVRQGWIQLPALVAYEIPTETELLRNYPNPFNPETWIPYRLAEDAFVTLTIYDLNGQVVRTLDVGHRIAAVYEGRSKAIYWDGRNGLGEGVASGIYFYHLSAGDYSATRKMLILK